MSVLSKYKHYTKRKDWNGRYNKSPKLFPAIIIVPVLVFLVGVAYNAIHAKKTILEAYKGSSEVVDNCQTRLKDGSCDLTSTSTRKAWEQSEKSPWVTLIRTCEGKGIAGILCPSILAGMARQESVFGKKMSGDSGKSMGWFHINTTWHDIKKDCAYSLSCSANWTLNRMLAKGYKTNWQNAVRLHNGSVTNPKTLAYLNSVKHWMVTFVPTLY